MIVAQSSCSQRLLAHSTSSVPSRVQWFSTAEICPQLSEQGAAHRSIPGGLLSYQVLLALLVATAIEVPSRDQFSLILSRAMNMLSDRGVSVEELGSMTAEVTRVYEQARKLNPIESMF